MTQQPEKKSADSESASSVLSDDRRESRRRLLRMGVKAAPAVAATLVGQQALACHCTIPSAWGSIAKTTGTEDMGGAVDLGKGSFATRYGNAIKSYSNTYRDYSSWGGSGAGWTALVSKANQKGYAWPAGVSANPDKILWLQGKKTVQGANNGRALSASQLVNIFFPNIALNWGRTSPLPLDVAVSGNRRQRAVLIAFLARATGATWGNQCLTLAQLRDMGNGTFKTSLDSAAWTDDQVEDYLHNNWMVRIN